jgi:hypothetical protein
VAGVHDADLPSERVARRVHLFEGRLVGRSSRIEQHGHDLAGGQQFVQF